MEIKFNSCSVDQPYQSIIKELLNDYSSIRNKHYSQKCIKILEKTYPDSSLFLTHSATAALEMIALLIDIQKGDEVILPSFTFISTANAFVSLGAVPVFVDIDPETFNMDLNQVEDLITENTKAVIAVHYAGHACDLIHLKTICNKHNIFMIEDAAMSFGNTFRGNPLGTYGDMGVISFDVTKQISSVQGGLLLVNNKKFSKSSNIVYNIGTNKQQLLDGDISYYEWVGKGSKFQMNELSAVVLYSQLMNYSEILIKRRNLSLLYYQLLADLEKNQFLKIIPSQFLSENFNTFYILLKNKNQRETMALHLSQYGIETMFHYIPLHDSKMGVSFGRKELPITNLVSDCLLRLPLHSQLKETDVHYITDKIKEFWR